MILERTISPHDVEKIVIDTFGENILSLVTVNDTIVLTLPKDKPQTPLLQNRNIDALLKDSVTESLIGAIPNSDKSLNDYRSERLSKYASVD